MTTTTTGGEPRATFDTEALTVAGALEVIACPLCGPAEVPGCHPLSRLRAVLALQRELEARAA